MFGSGSGPGSGLGSRFYLYGMGIFGKGFYFHCYYSSPGFWLPIPNSRF